MLNSTTISIISADQVNQSLVLNSYRSLSNDLTASTGLSTADATKLLAQKDKD
jgi:hypothetical protein